MQEITITKNELRKFLIHYHGLGTRKFTGIEGLKEYFELVRCIQYDPLDVVGRNVDLVLQSRVEGYTSEMLQSLLYEERFLIDGWDKMMSIYPTTDWTHFRRIREQAGIATEKSLQKRNVFDALVYVDDIRKQILECGPCVSGDFDFGKIGKERWGQRKISGLLIEYMFSKGILGVSERKGTNKQYDLIEKLLPKEILEQSDPFASDEDFYKW